MEEIRVTDTDYPDNQTAEIMPEINSDLIDTRGEDDEPADK